MNAALSLKPLNEVTYVGKWVSKMVVIHGRASTGTICIHCIIQWCALLPKVTVMRLGINHKIKVFISLLVNCLMIQILDFYASRLNLS